MWFVQIVCVINIVTVITYMLDNAAISRNGYRVPNSFLWLLNVCFGSFAAFVMMIATGNKSKNPDFRYGVPLLVLVHLLVGAWIIMVIT